MADEATNASSTTDEQTNTSTDGQEKTFTQTDLDKIVIDRVRKAEAKYADYDDLKSKAAKVDELEPKLTEVTEERDSFKTASEKAEADSLRYSVALNKGLPVELVERLRGSTEEEIQADADSLLKLVAPKPSGLDGGSRESAPTSSMNDVLRGIRRN